MLVRQPQSFAAVIDKLRTLFTVCLVSASDIRNSFPNQSMGDDEVRFSVIALLRVVVRIEKRLHVFAVDFLNVEAVGLDARGCVFALSRGRGCIERDGGVIVNRKHIIETEMAGEGARLRGKVFLHATVPCQASRMLVENSVVGSIEPVRRHFARDRDADCVASALAERTSSAFDARCIAKFWMPRRLGM